MPIFVWPTGQGAGAAGSCDYPAVGDVQEGVTYGSGAYTGTFAWPAVGNVRLGIGYGAGGTEFTGTLAVPVSGAGQGTDYLSAIVAVMRANGLIETVAVEVRLAGDAYSAPENWEAHRMPQTSEDYGGLAENTMTFGLYKIAGQTRNPARLTRITDSDGVEWYAQRVTRGFYGLHFNAVCTKAIS